MLGLLGSLGGCRTLGALGTWAAITVTVTTATVAAL
jgi:hypothetical protein